MPLAEKENDNIIRHVHNVIDRKFGARFLKIISVEYIELNIFVPVSTQLVPKATEPHNENDWRSSNIDDLALIQHLIYWYVQPVQNLLIYQPPHLDT